MREEKSPCCQGGFFFFKKISHCEYYYPQSVNNVENYRLVTNINVSLITRFCEYIY